MLSKGQTMSGLSFNIILLYDTSPPIKPE
jgi:hypothetical protein